MGNGGHNHIINKICSSFEENPPELLPNDECLALKHVESWYENLDSRTTEMLHEFRRRLDTEQSMIDMVKEYGIMRTLRLGFTLWPTHFHEYLAAHAQQFTNRREAIKFDTFLRQVLGKGAGDFRCGNTTENIDTYEKYHGKLWKIVGTEEKKQQKLLPATNHSIMRQDSDKWTLFWLKDKGTSLQSGTHDFSQITNPHYKAAFKHYLAEKRWRQKDNFRSENIVGMTARALNFLSERTKAKTPSAVGITQVRKLVIYLCTEALSFKGEPLKQSSVRGHFKILNGMWDYLMRQDVSVPDGQPEVKTNSFRAVSFKNEASYTKSAEYIPEEVLDQIFAYHLELPDEVGRCLRVMNGTGLRYQDAVLLEESCLRYDDDLALHVLRFIPHKSRKARRRKGLSDYHEIGIENLDVVCAIMEQKRCSASLRAESGSNRIFLTKSSERSTRVTILSAHGFVNPIRLLIQRRQITDHDGNLWQFNSHQCRKSVAVTMVENKAAPIEIRQFLGHMDERTTNAIYAEVRKINLAKMNHEFFEKKFKTKIPPEHLAKFSPEERKLLYVEFALGHREVELGQCLKPASEGQCGKRTGKTHCAICGSLCTGPQYEKKWRSLVESQEHEIAEYEKAYQQAEIPEDEYKDYVEYKKAKTLFKEYSATLNRIRAYGT